jgi:hypothetical protein
MEIDRRAATSAIKEFFSVVYVAYASLVVAFGWCVVWSLAMFGVINYYDNKAPQDSSSAQGVSLFSHFLKLEL